MPSFNLLSTVSGFRNLKGKLRHVKNFFSKSLSKHQFESGSTKLKVVRSAPLIGVRARVLMEKMPEQSKEMICLKLPYLGSLGGCLL